eukprot:SAG31_NODE_16_length_36206_cov_27.355728_19_plen_504_part_00
MHSSHAREMLFLVAMVTLHPSFGSGLPPESCPFAAGIALAAQQRCNSLPIGAALRAVQLPSHVADEAEQLMAAVGLKTTLDLQLIGNVPEADELMDQLSGNGLALGYRAKLRLLLNDQRWRLPVGAPHMSQALESHRSSHGNTQDVGMAPPKCIQRHRLQGGGNGSADGLSSDTIAIVLSMMVGTIGYLVQAYTARRAERAAADTAQEERQADAAKERLHHQMAAQIKRIDRALDEGCRPMGLALLNVHLHLCAFVGEAVTEMQPTHPEAVAHLLELSSSAVTINDDNTHVTSARTGRTIWDAAASSQGLIRLEATSNAATASSVASCALYYLCSVAYRSQPYASEFPTAIMQCIESDPASPLARMFQLTVRTCLLPTMQEVAQLLRAHAALMQLPPTTWLKSTFPIEHWSVVNPDIYRVYWLIRTSKWLALTKQWDAGDMSSMLPSRCCCFPLGGLTAINSWAIAHGEGQQRELIGVTTEVESGRLDVSDIGRQLNALAPKE